MKSGDSYNKNSEFQRDAGVAVIERLMGIGIDGIYQYRNGSDGSESSSMLDDNITVVDYGCAGGRNSLSAIDLIINKIVTASSNDKTKSITVIYNDQPTNDWTVAIATIINNKESYIHKQYSTPIHFHTLFSPQSFYEQVCADNSVTIGFSTAAMHWISRVPCQLKNNIVPFGDSAADDILEWKKQGESDWQTLLTRRYHELKHGGIIQVNMMGRRGDDRDPSLLGSKISYKYVSKIR